MIGFLVNVFLAGIFIFITLAWKFIKWLVETIDDAIPSDPKPEEDDEEEKELYDFFSHYPVIGGDWETKYKEYRKKFEHKSKN